MFARHAGGFGDEFGLSGVDGESTVGGPVRGCLLVGDTHDVDGAPGFADEAGVEADEQDHVQPRKVP